MIFPFTVQISHNYVNVKKVSCFKASWVVETAAGFSPTVIVSCSRN